MPLKKISFKPGVNRENTRYTTEGGWYDCNWVRFRQGTPEKIGGIRYTSSNVYSGLARSLWAWVTLDGIRLLGVGAYANFYLYGFDSQQYYDITPFRDVEVLTDPFTTTSGSKEVDVYDAAGGVRTFTNVSFYPAVTLNGVDIYGKYSLVVSVPYTDYYIQDDQTASASGNGGGTVYALYNINAGPSIVIPSTGWGAGGWGFGTWGVGLPTKESLRLWSQGNFGEDLIFAPRGGTIYYWDASFGPTKTVATFSVASPTVVTTTLVLPNGSPIRFVPAQNATMPTGVTPGTLYYVRNFSSGTFNISLTPSGALVNVTIAATNSIFVLPNAYALSERGGATDVPTIQNVTLVSDVNRFVFAFGANDYGSTAQDRMLVRWSDQDDPFNWTPAATNQAGFLRLSRGSQIIAAIQSRQEILVWTDCALYSLQYVGAPIVWSAQLLADNITIVGQNAVTFSNGVTYWMGKGKFYKYDGRVQTMRCDLRRYVFENINKTQYEQTVAGTIEQFNEVWWYYVDKNNYLPTTYVVYNYAEDIWYYGGNDLANNGARTAWLDVGIWDYPVAASSNPYLYNLEFGLDNDYYPLQSAEPFISYISSSQFDLEDGDKFMFIWRVLPDLTFEGSTAEVPSGILNLLPLRNSGSGYTPGGIVYSPISPPQNSVADSSYATVEQTAPSTATPYSYSVEQFTGQVYTRVRGRQLSIAFGSTDVGVTWQLGSMRLDMKPDGRR